jgi:hypothetical protein
VTDHSLRKVFLNNRSIRLSIMLLAGFFLLDCLRALDQASLERASTVRVVLSARGFEPRQISLRPGPVNLIVRSRLAGRAEFDLAEVGKSESKLSEASDKRKSVMSLNGRVNLAVGDYEIRDPRFPQWKCTLNVRP